MKTAIKNPAAHAANEVLIAACEKVKEIGQRRFMGEDEYALWRNDMLLAQAERKAAYDRLMETLKAGTAS